MRSRLRFASLATLTFVALACGSRTGLLIDEQTSISPTEEDPDGTVRRDASRDARVNADADALPPIDVRPPVDVDRRDCPDADATLVYLITTSYDLYSFYPPEGSFRFIGQISCPDQGTATPFSMAVDRKGIASVVYNDGRLFRVSTATASCQATSFRVRQEGFNTFGMGYASDTNGPAEKLYVAGDANFDDGATGLGWIDSNLTLRKIGDFDPLINRAELTGTGAGDLFAFYSSGSTEDSFVGQIDKQTARVVGQTRIAGVNQGSGWAFAFWGGDFWLFTAPTGGSSIVTRFRPSDNSITKVAQLSSMIVGAGVSTCAPQQ